MNGDDDDPRWDIATAPTDHDDRIAAMVKTQVTAGYGNVRRYGSRPVTDGDFEAGESCERGKEKGKRKAVSDPA